MDTLRKGDQGPQVTQLQQLLTQRGYAVPVNGTFDTRTWRAVRAFQSARSRAALAAAIVELKAGAREQGDNNCGPFVHKPAVQGFSYVLSRMDKLLGLGHVP